MKSKRKINRTPDPEVLAQLKEWAGLKTHVALDCRFVFAPLTVAGELHADEEKPDVFFFTTWNREFMVTLLPAIYESQSLKKSEDGASIKLRGFGGEISIRELTSRVPLLLDAAPLFEPDYSPNQEAAAREQIAEWVSAKSEVSLVFVGSFSCAGTEGHLEQASDNPKNLLFSGTQTSFRSSIWLDRCVVIKAPGRDDRAIVMLQQGATGPSLILSDPKHPIPDMEELLKLSSGRPN